MLLATPARAATTGLERLLPREARQVAPVGVGDDHDVAAASPIPSVGAALRHVLLAPEAEPTVAASAGLDANARPVVEHGAQTSRMGRVPTHDPLQQSVAKSDRERRFGSAARSLLRSGPCNSLLQGPKRGALFGSPTSRRPR